MTDGKGKRGFWRRRPRRKKGGDPTAASPEAGVSGASGTASPEEDAAVEGQERVGEEPVFNPPAEPAESEPSQDVIGIGDPATLPKKGRRRRSRKRGGKGAAQAAPDAGDGEAPPPAGADVPEMVAQDSRVEGEAQRAGDEARETQEHGAPEGEGAAAPRKGRRRRRRRGRRRGEGAPAGEVALEGAASREEAIAGAEAADSEEYVSAVVDAGEPPEEDAEYVEEETPPGGGPRRVMLIDGLHPEEIRVAITSDGTVDYFEVENQRKKQFKGNIYKAKVVNVAHAIEAAFVEFGSGRHGFLPLNEYCGGALIENLGTWNEGEKRPHLRHGMEILVQVTKEESSVKGAAVTSYISIAGRYLVMMLGMQRYGISKKITAEKDRERIRKNMEKLEYPEHLGFIVRTVGANRPLKDLKADLQNLLKLWDRTVAGARSHKAPALLYEEQDIVVRTLRDNYSSDVAEVLMNSEDSHRKATAFFDVYYPERRQTLKLIRQKRPLFSKFNLEEQVERLCARKVPLPSGGHIVIDRTEAMWSIDVNSGRSSKDRDIEDTAYRTNKEAALEVGRQLRLRDIGGLIVVDFIDMENKGHVKDVEKTLKETMKRDKAKSDVSAMGKFGLVAISRQRMGISYYDILMKGCELCGGTGAVSTRDASVVRLLRRVHDELSREYGKVVTMLVSPILLETLLNQKRDEVTRMEKASGSRVAFLSDATLPPGSFSVAPAAS